ncbi:transcriptional regulator [Paraburkholderia tuberum]|uniref:transcriptional regulator n=1 Tax=Paraburkholderia tuberum TaxID=157910 RepID=UPI000B811CFD|nr:YdaS family helix-turn-helix protein [Paraburkholderia tuberum]
MEHFIPIKEACDAARGLTAFARMIGVKPPTAHEWLTRRRPVPPRRCARIETLFGISRQRLRPDDWQEIWPELIGKPGSPPVPAEREVA